MAVFKQLTRFFFKLKWSQNKKPSEIFAKGLLNEVTKKLSKEVTKSLLKKSHMAVTVTQICIKVLQKASQNNRHKIVTTG
jgi:hypothetical protein